MILLREYALKFVGVPYVWGGSNAEQGFDCGGLIQELLKSVGLDPPGDQTAQSLFDHFSQNGKWKVHGLGSLAFYGKDAKSISHVAFMIDNYRIIEAGGGDSTTKTRADAARQNAFVRVRLLNHRKDLVAVIKPSYFTIGMP